MAQKVHWIIISICIAGILSLISLIASLPDGRLHVFALDIGQGDAILIRTPEGKNILMDGGPKTTVLERLGEQLGFFEKTLDMVIISHPHADHIDGLAEVLKRFEIKKVLLTGVIYNNSTYQEIMRVITEKGIPFDFARSDRDYQIEPGVTLDIIFPKEEIFGMTFDNVNNSSIVAKLHYGSTSLLLTGDAEKEAEFEILRTPADLSATLLKAGHHGSRTSSSPPWVGAVNPDTVLISAGRDNSFGHPHPETMKLFAARKLETFVTKDEGTIEMISDGKEWKRAFDL